MGDGGREYLALANVEAVSFWGVFCGQVQVSGLQEVSRSGRGGWVGGGETSGKAPVSLSPELLDLSVTGPRPLNLPGGF